MDDIDINLVISLLELTFRAGKDQDRGFAELQLQKLAQRTIEMSNVLLKILSTEGVNEFVKESASLFILKLFRSQTIKSMQNAMEFKTNILTSMLSGLGSALPFRVKNNLKEILIAIMQDDSNSFLKKKIRQTLIPSFQSNQILEYLKGFMITEALLGVTTNIGEVTDMFLELIGILNSIAAKLLIIFVEHLKIVMGNRGKEAPSKLTGEGAILFHALSSWAEIIELFTRRFCETRSAKLENLFSNQNLAQLISEILTLTFRSQTQFPDCIFSTTSVEAVDDALNYLKKSMIFVLNMIVLHSLKRSTKSANLIKASQIFKTMQSITPALVQSVIRIAKNLENIENSENLKNVVHTGLALLNNCVKTLEIYQIFAQNKETLSFFISLFLLFFFKKSYF